jgi:hypothetical protein
VRSTCDDVFILTLVEVIIVFVGSNDSERRNCGIPIAREVVT